MFLFPTGREQFHRVLGISQLPEFYSSDTGVVAELYIIITETETADNVRYYCSKRTSKFCMSDSEPLDSRRFFVLTNIAANVNKR